MSEPARFHALRDRVVAAVDQVFAEPVEIKFLDARGRQDAARPAVTVEAILRSDPERVSSPAGGRTAESPVRVSAAPAKLFIDPWRYEGPEIRRGDKVVAVSRPGEPVFEVLSVQARTHTRMVCTLGEAG